MIEGMRVQKLGGGQQGTVAAIAARIQVGVRWDNGEVETLDARDLCAVVNDMSFVEIRKEVTG